jgi:hypothetical protein
VYEYEIALFQNGYILYIVSLLVFETKICLVQHEIRKASYGCYIRAGAGTIDLALF